MSEPRFEVLLSIGSNVDTDASVRRARELIGKRFASVVVSSTWEGPGIGADGRPDPSLPPFANLAARVRTDLPFRALREVLRFIESLVGRTRTDDAFAPRTLDLDPVFGDAPFLATSAGALPAAELRERAYVLVPAAEVWPDAVLDGRRLDERVLDLDPDERGMLRRRTG